MKTTHRNDKRNGCATERPLPLPPRHPPPCDACRVGGNADFMVRRWKCRVLRPPCGKTGQTGQSWTSRARWVAPPAPWSGQVPAKAPEKKTYNPQAHKHIYAQTDTQTDTQTQRRRHRDIDTQTQTDTERHTKTHKDRHRHRHDRGDSSVTLISTDAIKAFRTNVRVATHLGRLPPVLITQAVVETGLLVSGNVTVRKTYRNRWQAHRTKSTKRHACRKSLETPSCKPPCSPPCNRAPCGTPKQSHSFW